MTYEETLNAIHRRRTFSGGGPTLDRICRLMEALGNPQENFKSVHIAGTNGKGSVAAMTAAALRESGFHTGLFTSPYLLDFRERIQIDGEMIAQTDLVSCYETVMEQENRLEARGFEPVNEFELVTAIGFLYFSRKKVDYAVLEVGLGGRTDPTNLITKPAACCITPISLDHTAVLGNTIEKIAGEKAGILKEDCPAVFARQSEAALGVLFAAAKEKNAPAVLAEMVTPLFQDKTGSRFLCDGKELCIPLLGDFQMENAAAAMKLCQLIDLPEEAVRRGFETVKWPGRLAYFPGPPELLVDAGHNPGGIDALLRCLEELFPGKDVIAVMSMMQDKDHAYCISQVAKRAEGLIGTSVGLPRSLAPDRIAAAAEVFCPAYTAPDMRAAMALAGKMAETALIVVCGSVYGAGAVLELLEQNN